MESVLCDIMFSVFMFYWISSDQVLEDVINKTEISSRFYYYVNSLISHYLPCDWQITIAHVIKKTIIILHDSFVLFTFKYIYLKYLQSGPKCDPSISNNMWPHVFRYKVGSYFTCFLVMCLAHIFLPICENFPLTLKVGRCWNPLSVDSWLNRTDSSHNIISCPIQHQIRNTTWKSISKIE